jgi:hypothetical protein
LGECNPDLEELGITDWRDSTGRPGLADLEKLRVLEIEGGFDDPSVLSSMPRLQTLRVELASDTWEARDQLRALLPACEIEFL